MQSNKELQIPFCSLGMLHPSDYYGNGGRKFYYVPQSNWDDHLYYVGIVRGRSALKFEFKSLKTGLRYFFLQKDFDDLMKAGVLGQTIADYILRTSVLGNFEFVKRGSSYGIKLVK